ncbi:unnamed protein product [Prorocentrum cordatum]|uniref:Uncharacterized protein n=1 Tax=Prorocentrum cordatum TaxID=2364126 RepID=A0ABN9UM67_9DINO|nr:unnamed protein product [Polarella glacialis]
MVTSQSALDGDSELGRSRAEPEDTIKNWDLWPRRLQTWLDQLANPDPLAQLAKPDRLAPSRWKEAPMVLTLQQAARGFKHLGSQSPTAAACVNALCACLPLASACRDYSTPTSSPLSSSLPSSRPSSLDSSLGHLRALFSQ